MNNVLIKPLVTEKLTGIQEKLNQYAFEVAYSATKNDIKEAVEKKYPEVTVTKVRTLVMPGKPKGRHTKSGFLSGRTKQVKKALVSLKTGQEIDFFSEI
ncbi:MAG: 50S ribosomal protein L23 [Flavobacteriaceae bacterium]